MVTLSALLWGGGTSPLSLASGDAKIWDEGYSQGTQTPRRKGLVPERLLRDLKLQTPDLKKWKSQAILDPERDAGISRVKRL